MSVPALSFRIASDGAIPESRPPPNMICPWTLIHEEQFPTRAAAIAGKRCFKTGRGRYELDQLHCQRAVAAATGRGRRRRDAEESREIKHGLPRILIHEEKLPTRAAATTRECYFKSARRRDGLYKLCHRSCRRGDRSQVQILSPRRQKSCPMSFLRHFFFLLTLGAAGTVRAQSSPSPDGSSAETANTQMAATTASPSPSATVSIEPPSLIPPNILPAPDSLPKIPATQELQQLNEFFKKTSLGKVADEHRLHLQMVALETRIRNDQDLHASKATAWKASTDLERRHWLKSYYELYFKKLRALATTPDLKAYLDAHEAARKLSLLQPKVRHESDEKEAAALAKSAAGTTAPKALPTPVQARASEVVHP